MAVGVDAATRPEPKFVADRLYCITHAGVSTWVEITKISSSPYKHGDHLYELRNVESGYWFASFHQEKFSAMITDTKPLPAKPKYAINAAHWLQTLTGFKKFLFTKTRVTAYGLEYAIAAPPSGHDAWVAEAWIDANYDGPWDTTAGSPEWLAPHGLLEAHGLMHPNPFPQWDLHDSKSFYITKPTWKVLLPQEVGVFQVAAVFTVQEVTGSANDAFPFTIHATLTLAYPRWAAMLKNWSTSIPASSSAVELLFFAHKIGVRVQLIDDWLRVYRKVRGKDLDAGWWDQELATAGEHWYAAGERPVLHREPRFASHNDALKCVLQLASEADHFFGHLTLVPHILVRPINDGKLTCGLVLSKMARG